MYPSEMEQTGQAPAHKTSHPYVLLPDAVLAKLRLYLQWFPGKAWCDSGGCRIEGHLGS